MADPPKLPDGPTPSSPLHPAKRSREDAGFDDDEQRRSVARGLRTSNTADIAEGNGEAAWYSAISNRSFHAPVPEGSQLPTPRTYGPNNTFPFFPIAVGSPESPLAYTHSRTLGGTSGLAMAPRIQSRPDQCIEREFQGPRNIFSMQLQTITPKASPMGSPASLPARPLSLPLLSSTSQEHPVFVKTESPPPTLAPAHDISPSKSSSSQAVSPEVQPTELSLSSPFLEKARPSAALNGVKHGDPSTSQLVQSQSQSPSTSAQPTVLFSPAHIEVREPLSSQVTNQAQLSTEERDRLPGGELDRIRGRILSVEDARKAELESRRPEYLKRLQRGDGIESSGSNLEEDGLIEKDSLGIMTTPAKGRRIQLFDFQETSAESFEESLMTHGYGTYGEPRTPHKPLAATEGLSQEAIDWLAYNTPATVPGSRHPHFGLEIEQNEKELKKRKRLEAFKGSTARAYAKLYPAEVEGLGRVLLNVPPEGVDELSGSPAKKRATGKKKRGGAAAERKGKMPRGSIPVHAESTEPRWLDKEIPWCLREKEREEEVKARDADRLKWIDKYLGHDTDSDDEMDSDKIDEDLPSPSWGQTSEDAPDALRRGRGKAVPLQADPNHSRLTTRNVAVRAPDTGKNKNLFFPTDPADARTALMSKRSVRLLAQRKLRQNGQRPASLRGIGEGHLACACGRDDDDDGRPAVQCDDCYNWHHLECIGVHDESELGEEDDPWFCPVCTARSEATLLASDWRNQRQPTFVPTDDRPVHTSSRSDVAFYSSSPLRDWGSSGSLHTPVQGQGRLHNSEFFQRSIWDDPRTGPGPSTPVTMSQGVQVHTPGTGHGEPGHINMFDPLISPRTGYPKFGTSFTTPKNTNSGHPPGGSSSGLPWPTHSGGLFVTPTSRGRPANPGSAGFGFSYASEDLMNAQFAASFGHSARSDAMYAVDDTPIRRAPAKEIRMLGPSLHPSSGALIDSPLAGRGGQSFAGQEESPDVRRAPVK